MDWLFNDFTKIMVSKLPVYFVTISGHVIIGIQGVIFPRFSTKVSSTPRFWLGNWYSVIKLSCLLLIVISKLIDSWSIEMSLIFNTMDVLETNPNSSGFIIEWMIYLKYGTAENFETVVIRKKFGIHVRLR